MLIQTNKNSKNAGRVRKRIFSEQYSHFSKEQIDKMGWRVDAERKRQGTKERAKEAERRRKIRATMSPEELEAFRKKDAERKRKERKLRAQQKGKVQNIGRSIRKIRSNEDTIKKTLVKTSKTTNIIKKEGKKNIKKFNSLNKHLTAEQSKDSTKTSSRGRKKRVDNMDDNVSTVVKEGPKVEPKLVCSDGLLIKTINVEGGDSNVDDGKIISNVECNVPAIIADNVDVVVEQKIDLNSELVKKISADMDFENFMDELDIFEELSMDLDLDLELPKISVGVPIIVPCTKTAERISLLTIKDSNIPSLQKLAEQVLIKLILSEDILLLPDKSTIVLSTVEDDVDSGYATEQLTSNDSLSLVDNNSANTVTKTILSEDVVSNNSPRSATILLNDAEVFDKSIQCDMNHGEKELESSESLSLFRDTGRTSDKQLCQRKSHVSASIKTKTRKQHVEMRKKVKQSSKTAQTLQSIKNSSELSNETYLSSRVKDCVIRLKKLKERAAARTENSCKEIINVTQIKSECVEQKQTISDLLEQSFAMPQPRNVTRKNSSIIKNKQTPYSNSDSKVRSVTENKYKINGHFNGKMVKTVTKITTESTICKTSTSSFSEVLEGINQKEILKLSSYSSTTKSTSSSFSTSTSSTSKTTSLSSSTCSSSKQVAVNGKLDIKLLTRTTQDRFKMKEPLPYKELSRRTHKQPEKQSMHNFHKKRTPTISQMRSDLKIDQSIAWGKGQERYVRLKNDSKIYIYFIIYFIYNY